MWTGQLLGYKNPYINKQHRDLVQKFPLCITTDGSQIKSKPSTLISIQRTYLYAGLLTGEFALALASYLLNENGNLFILGYDWTQKTKSEEVPETHYYSDTEINHKGQHLTQHYDTHDAGKVFRRFLNLNNNLKIYNVSLNSNIPTFKKITYPEMFSLLNKETYNQDELRKYIKEKLNALSNNV
jgi:hypothetical protein